MQFFICCIVMIQLLVTALSFQTSRIKLHKLDQIHSLSMNSQQTGKNGYDLLGSLSRQGPVPVFIRIFQSEKYEQSVTKFMLLEKCSRTEAMANMDAYFQDPNTWLLNRKLYDDGKKEKIDYVNANQNSSEQILTILWASVLFAIFSKIVYGIVVK